MREDLKRFINERTVSHQRLLEQEALEAGILQPGDRLFFSIDYRQVPVAMPTQRSFRTTGRHGNVTYLPDELTMVEFRDILSHNYHGRTSALIAIFQEAGGKPVPHTAFNEAFNEADFRIEGKFCGLNNAFRNHGKAFRAKAVAEKDGIKYYKICKIKKP